MMRGILELAEDTLQIPVRQGLPLGFEGLTKELAHPTYACAVGLTMLEAKKDSQLDFHNRPRSVPLIERILSWFEQ